MRAAFCSALYGLCSACLLVICSSRFSTAEASVKMTSWGAGRDLDFGFGWKILSMASTGVSGGTGPVMDSGRWVEKNEAT